MIRGLNRLEIRNGFPVLDEHFGTNIPGLFMTSMAAVQDFGPFFAFTVSVRTSAMLIGQATLGQLSDRYGRKPLIVLGLILSVMFYLSLLFLRSFGLLFLGALVTGIGGALVSLALSAAYLDIAAPEHSSQVMGIRGASASLGGVIGPLLVAVVSLWIAPQGIFAIAGGVTLGAVMLALLVLKGRTRSRGAAAQSVLVN